MYRIILIIVVIISVYIIITYDVEKYTEKQYDLDRDIIPRSSTYMES